ncbi:MAG TPA: protein dpnD [Bacteroidetes bacterium]|nr:protein dpnD [Bacteroidota bacterium]
MKKFEFEIKELLSRIIEVEAENENDAYLKVIEMYKNDEIVLDSSDFVDSEINKFELKPFI